MNPQKFQEQILNNAVQMAASVSFQLNGNMLIVPCPWETDQIMSYFKTRKEETVWK